MKQKRIIVTVLSVTLILLMASAAIAPAVHYVGLPKLDTVYFKAYPGAVEDVIVQEFLDCETDWIEGPYRSDLYDAVIDAGHNVSPMDPMASCSIFAINCRDYKVTSGLPNAPLNDSKFRVALSYIYGMDDKQADVFGYYGVPWVSALGNPVPSAQLPWHNSTIQMPNSDNDTAWVVLHGAFYTVEDYGGQQWLHKNGVPVRPPDGPNGGIINFWYPTGYDFYPLGVGGGFVRNFNAFITDYLGAEGPLMVINPTDYLTLLLDLYYIRDFDIIGTELTDLGRYVKWLWSTLHSRNDVPGGSNFCGIHDADFDNWTEIIMTGWNVAMIIAAASKVQERFVYEVMPWFPAIEGSEFCTTKVIDSNNFLTNLISMPIYGPRNSYSYMCLHWYGMPGVIWPGGSCTVALRDEPDTLNPWTDYSQPGWEIMERSILTGETGLLGISPSTLSNTPFVATNWTAHIWISIPELGIENGCMTTFWLRQGVPWHDNGRNGGEPHYVDAYDCVANLEFLRRNQPPRWSHVWEHLVYSEADGPFNFSAYFDQMSLCHASHVSDVALLVPEEIIEIVEPYWVTWDPSQLDYEALGLGPPPAAYPFLKQLVGCGPFVFNYYDRSLAVGQVDKFEEFFVNSPVIGSVAGEWQIELGDDYPYEVLIHNIGAKTWDNWGHLTNAVVDVAIYHDDALAHVVNDTNLDPWNYTYLPGSTYTWTGPECGSHRIKVVVVGDQFRNEYEHAFVVTIREDISTWCGDLLDFKVDMRDIGRACRAFGSYPGHGRWDPCCDVNGDFKVDMKDIGAICRVFGWEC